MDKIILEGFCNKLEKEGFLDRSGIMYLISSLLNFITDNYMTEIVEKHPHHHRLVEKLVSLYRELLEDLRLIQFMPDHMVKEVMISWINCFKKYQKHENCLLMDFYNIDYGGDH